MRCWSQLKNIKWLKDIICKSQIIKTYFNLTTDLLSGKALAFFHTLLQINLFQTLSNARWSYSSCLESLVTFNFDVRYEVHTIKLCLFTNLWLRNPNAYQVMFAASLTFTGSPDPALSFKSLVSWFPCFKVIWFIESILFGYRCTIETILLGGITA